MGTRPYVVRSGDYLTAIAHQNGTTVETILALPANAALKKRRPHPEILAPLDLVYVPDRKPKWHPLTVGAENLFTATVPKITVQVVLKGQDGKPLANKKVTTQPELSKGPITTDGDGLLKLEVSVLVRKIDVIVQDSGTRFHLRVGHLDPHDEDSGLLSRLRQLGCVGNEGEHIAARPWLVDHARVANRLAISRGIEAFQKKKGKDATGEVDDDVRAAIRDEHGC